MLIMSWARDIPMRRKQNFEKSDKRFAVKCHGCGVTFRFASKLPTKPEWCRTCEELRMRHKIPW
ncbi:unnamed protein product [marine sediment metagenome]|uniref:Uncharacterized protein n=1 Tax=marine sediment metagenome TaxID=412755 RepID=X1NPH9_9ZZZZ